MSAGTATVEGAVATARSTARFSSAVLVSAAMAASGVLTYAFQILAARRLDAGAFGQIAVLWGGVFLLAIVVFRPLEQTLSRTIADRLARGEEVRSVLRAIAVMAIAASCLIAAAAGGAWPLVTRRLFHGDDFMTAMLLAGTVGYGAQYFVRGLLGGVRWFAGYSAVLVGDSVGRLAVALPLLVVVSPHLAAAAAASAGLAGALAPFALDRGWASALAGGDRGRPFDRRDAARFAGPAGAVAAADQLLINGGPLLVMVFGTGGSADAGLVFAATMLVRAPVYVFTGIAASLLPNFTLLAGSARRELAAIFRRTLTIVTAAGAVIVAGSAVLGPTAMDVLYGAGFGATRVDLVLLAASVSLYLAAATWLQALLAFGWATAGACAWSAAAVALVAVYALTGGAELERVAIALVAATALNALAHGALVTALLRRRP
jgi:O-antigen/teichoic acid export membrane protein